MRFVGPGRPDALAKAAQYPELLELSRRGWHFCWHQRAGATHT